MRVEGCMFMFGILCLSGFFFKAVCNVGEGEGCVKEIQLF